MAAALQCPDMVDRFGNVWMTAHRDVPFAFRDCDFHYLGQVALSLDDDLDACLLLRKLRLARVHPDDCSRSGAARLGSRVRFRHGGRPRQVMLVHGSGEAEGEAVGIGSRTGVGLVGLAAGQSVLWPTRTGKLEELHVLAVANAEAEGARPASGRTGP